MKRWIAVVLSVYLSFAMLPLNAFAAGNMDLQDYISFVEEIAKDMSSTTSQTQDGLISLVRKVESDDGIALINAIEAYCGHPEKQQHSVAVPFDSYTIVLTTTQILGGKPLGTNGKCSQQFKRIAVLSGDESRGTVHVLESNGFGRHTFEDGTDTGFMTSYRFYCADYISGKAQGNVFNSRIDYIDTAAEQYGTIRGRTEDGSYISGHYEMVSRLYGKHSNDYGAYELFPTWDELYPRDVLSFRDNADYTDYISAPTDTEGVATMKLLTRESLPWTGEGCGIHYTIRFAVMGQTVYHIEVGDNLLTVNNEDRVLTERWCRITIDDGREFLPEYDDYYAGWSEWRKSISRGVSTCGSFNQPIAKGVAPGQIMTVEVWQRATTLQDVLQPQILCAPMTNPKPADPRYLVYGYVVFDDNMREEIYQDEPFYPSVAPAATVGNFLDVFVTDYYADAVKWAVENGITSGTSATTFSPDATCTRGQVATFLWRAKGCPEPKTTVNPFSDIKTSDYYYKPILWAYENGITSGTSSTTFSPSATCTRAQVITFLWRADGEPTANVVEGTAWYSGSVAWATENKLLSGTAQAFTPNGLCPRADIVTYMYRNMGD